MYVVLKWAIPIPRIHIGFNVLEINSRICYDSNVCTLDGWRVRSAAYVVLALN